MVHFLPSEAGLLLEGLCCSGDVIIPALTEVFSDILPSGGVLVVVAASKDLLYQFQSGQ